MRDLPFESLHHLDGRRLEVSSPPVVPEPLPAGHDILERGLGQRLKGWKSVQKPLEGGDDPIHLGLLKHRLRHQTVITAPVTPPGQLTSRLSEPVGEEIGHLPRIK